VTGSAREAAKLPPLLLFLVLMVWLIATVRTVPASIVIGGGGAGAEAALFVELELEFVAFGDVLDPLHPQSARRTLAVSQRAITWFRIFSPLFSVKLDERLGHLAKS
jgi:hypothetical protein